MYTKNGHIFKIVQPVLSISVSNANVERVFSLMKQTWTDNRNRMDVSLVKAELCVKINFNFNCNEFHEYVHRTPKLIKLCQSSQKYE